MFNLIISISGSLYWFQHHVLHFKKLITRKQQYRFLYLSQIIIITCNGVLSDAILVKPTMSLKKIVALSKFSAVTGCPRLSSSATVLE